MSKDSGIEWTRHTFNPWWGCVKIALECKFCYAETLANRFGFDVWGPDAPRRFFGDAHWNEPLKWDKAADLAGERHRVFCASMADVFEDLPALEPWRYRLWDLIATTINLDWLLLTKRPENIWPMLPRAWHIAGVPSNVMFGTTAGTRETWKKNVGALIEIPHERRFVSAEPLLEDLGKVDLSLIHWLIVGGESGHYPRVMLPEWARSLRDQCNAAGVPFLFKQWGELVHLKQIGATGYTTPGNHHDLRTLIGGRLNGHTLKVEKICPDGFLDLGKVLAGRELDGREWNEFPK